MNVIEKVESLDLNTAVPRSSRETMAGIAHLPRMVDKARAYQNNNLGEYIYPCPLDRHILSYLEVNPEDFAELAELNEDKQMSLWTSAASAARNQEELDIVNAKILDRKVDPEDMPYFLNARNLIDPTRTDVTTWDGLTDLEEGHIE